MKPEEITALPNTSDFWFIRYTVKNSIYCEPAQKMHDGTFSVIGLFDVVRPENVIEVLGPAVIEKKPEPQPEPQPAYGVYRVKYCWKIRVAEFIEGSNMWAIAGFAIPKKTSEIEEIIQYLGGPS